MKTRQFIFFRMYTQITYRVSFQDAGKCYTLY